MFGDQTGDAYSRDGSTCIVNGVVDGVLQGYFVRLSVFFHAVDLLHVPGQYRVYY